MCYNSVILLQILTVKGFQIYLVGVSSSWFLLVCNIFSSLSELFFTSWHKEMTQVHAVVSWFSAKVIFKKPSLLSANSTEKLRFVCQLHSWLLGCCHNSSLKVDAYRKWVFLTTTVTLVDKIKCYAFARSLRHV